jgi:ligand-binding SRPBCC domain-containing protein
LASGNRIASSYNPSVPLIVIETWIAAPVERCFDLARDVEAHVASTGKTGERAVDGVTSGLVGLGQEVTWQAVHLGVRQRLTAKITRMERPAVFVDEMVRGAFRSFRHTHEFRPERGGTTMIDRFDYTSPLGALGRLADWMFLERYLRRFLEDRAAYLKARAEQQT